MAKKINENKLRGTLAPIETPPMLFLKNFIIPFDIFS